MQDHVSECKYKPVECPNRERGCLEKISANDVKKHLAEECQFRDVECQHCGEKTAQHLLQVSQLASLSLYHVLSN